MLGLLLRTDRETDSDSAREREKWQGKRRVKLVKYEVCKDVGNDAERVFHQLERCRF